MILARNILLWVLRHLFALVLILLILVVGRFALPPAIDWAQGQLEGARALPRKASTLSEAEALFAAWAERRRVEAERATAGLATAPQAALRTRRARIGGEIAARERERLSAARVALAAAAGDAERVFAHYRAGAEIALLQRERAYIDSLLAARSAQQRGQDLRQRRGHAEAELSASYRRWQAATQRVATLNQRPLADARNLLCRTGLPPVGCANYRALTAARAERNASAAANRQARRTIATIDRLLGSVAATQAAARDVSSAFEPQRRDLSARLEALERAASGNWLLWVRRPVMEVLPTALLILAGVIFAPLLIKVFLYFLVAPVASRRPPIRLVADENGELAAEGVASAVSQSVPLEPGAELLVLPEALQSTPHDAEKATQWLLNWSMPFSSLASRMVALVRVRVRRPDVVLVSATDNPLAEIALIRIGPGSAVALRPRTLRGLVQPIAEPMRITRHWRVGHLSAWLTLQLRYLVFHGPCTLIVQGMRGVRLEPAQRGRGINQAATIGFSARLAYAVRRTEVFGAYLIGKQELFNDSFEGEPGFCLYEEMPRGDAKGGLWGRGLQGLGDAVLKVFGL